MSYKYIDGVTYKYVFVGMCYILQCDAGGPDLRFPREKPECIGETSRDDAFHKVTM
jgi:hypothetical protein